MATSDTPNATIVAHEVVAPVQIVTPIVFVIDMVRGVILTVCNLFCVDLQLV